MNTKPILLLMSIGFFGLSSSLLADSVQLNVVPSSRAPFNAAQQWALELAKLKSVQVSSRNNGSARPEVKRSGSVVNITGVIDSGNRLIVPGGTFSIRQRPALQKWIEQQRSGDTSGAKGTDRFGLTPKQLKQTHASLKSVVRDSTKGKSVQEVVTSAARGSRLPLQYSTVAKRRVATAKVAGEWKDFTSGTVMAAALRPLELVMLPRADRSGQISLMITSDDSVDEGWPVGWKSELKLSELVPKFFDPLPMEIEKTPIADVTAALSGRLETPMQYDLALLKLVEIDPQTANVSYSAERTTYLKAVRTTLYRAKLKYEVRVDEVGSPFFWISPNVIPRARR